MARKLIALTLADAERIAGPVRPYADGGHPDDWIVEIIRETLGVEFYSFQYPVGAECFSELLAQNFSWAPIFEFHFDSDEVAQASFYYWKGKRFLLVEKYGDRTPYDWRILDTSTFVDFTRDLLEVYVKAKMEAMRDGTEETSGPVIAEGVNYLAFSQDNEEAPWIHIKFPRWAGDMAAYQRDYDLFLDDQRVVSVEWVHKKRQGHHADNDLARVTLENGEHKEVNGVLLGLARKVP